MSLLVCRRMFPSLEGLAVSVLLSSRFLGTRALIARYDTILFVGLDDRMWWSHVRAIPREYPRRETGALKEVVAEMTEVAPARELRLPQLRMQRQSLEVRTNLISWSPGAL
jgi:hypothetical protein